MERALLISMLMIWFWSTNPPFLSLPVKIPLANRSALRKALIVTRNLTNSWNISVYEVEKNIVPCMDGKKQTNKRKTQYQRGLHVFLVQLSKSSI